jgi:hypothetical protein
MKIGKFTNMWKLTHYLTLIFQWRNQNKNQNIPYNEWKGNKLNHTLWDGTKVILRGRFIAITTH